MSEIVCPIIHMNGDRAHTLVNALEAAYDAVRLAVDLTLDCAPNGRNYYPDPGRFERAMAQHVERLTHLNAVLQTLEDEAAAIQRLMDSRRKD